MSFKQIMPSYGVAQFTAQGTFLYVEKAPGRVRLRSDAGHYELTQGSQILNGRLSGLMTVENIGDEGQISLIVGNGEYRPPQRKDMTIESQPPIEIQSGQSVAIESLPKMEIKAGQSVAIASQPAMKIAPEQSLGVNSLPDVHLASGQQVSVSNLERVSGAFSSSEVSCPHTFASNGNRKKLIIRALETNANPVKVGALDLAAGERLTLETTAEVTVTGTDTIQYIEV